MNNNLINKIARLDIDDDELEKLNLASSSYYTCDTLIETLQNKKGTFKVLSVNCQSIRAKYDKRLLLIEQLKQYDLYFSIICLQESWLTRLIFRHPSQNRTISALRMAHLELCIKYNFNLYN